LDQILHKFERETPYNNFCHFFEADQFPYEKLGGNCFYRARKLAEVLRVAGYKVKFILTEDQMHIGLIVTKNRQTFYIDSSLMQLEPANINTVLREDDISIMEALPVINGSPSQICIGHISNGRFSVQKSIPNGREGEYVLATNANGEVLYVYDIRDASSRFPDNIAKQVQGAVGLTELTLRLVQSRGNELRINRNVSSGVFQLVKIGGSKGSIRRTLQPIEVPIVMQSLSERLGLEIDDLIGYFHRAIVMARR